MKLPPNYKALGSSERKPRVGAKRTGAADPKQMMTVSMRIRRRQDAPSLPDPAHMAERRRGEKHYTSREDFAAHYGASDADLDKIAQFARANGLHVRESSVARRTVVLEGTVEKMSKAFAVDLGVYEGPKEKYRGREGAVHVPTDISDLVEGVFYTTSPFRPTPRARRLEFWSSTAVISFPMFNCFTRASEFRCLQSRRSQSTM
jgi:kumamolisin